ncbi:sigma-70 family RNA polymerase sigma factor [Bacillus sp. CRN 9]|uniref:RNA polymerase sigma factor n=1 Tax=Cytobacillus horneckiae TaxID=549687 RepID=UPI002AA5B908
MNRKETLMKELCGQYEKRMYHIAYRITRDHYTAQDVVQESFVKAYMKLDTLQDHEKIGSWLAAITTRTAIDVVRKERLTKERTESIDDWEKSNLRMKQNVEDEVAAHIIEEKISRFIDSISTDQQNVYQLKMKAGLKEKEIAALLQLNQNTVKTKIYRLRKQLKQLLNNNEIIEWS